MNVFCTIVRAFGKGLLILLGTGVFASAAAQQVNEDSLQQIIQSSSYDTARIEALLALANYQVKHQRNDSLGLLTLNKAVQLSDKLKFAAGHAQAWLITGNYFSSKNKWAESIDAYNKMMDAGARIANDSLKGRMLMMANNNLGGIYNYNGDFENSLAYRLKALAMAEKYSPGNVNNLGVIYLNIASDYRQLAIPLKAIAYLQQTAAFFPRLPDRLKMEYYYEYHQSYLLADSAATARQLLDSIAAGLSRYNLSDFQKKDYELMLAKLTGRFALEQEKNYPLALRSFTNNLALAKELNKGTEITESLHMLGRTHLKAGNLPAAIAYLQSAYDSSLAGNLKNQRMKIAQELGNAYAAGNNFEKSAQFLQQVIDLKAEIYNETKTKELNFLEARYQHQKKENEIAALKISNAEKELSVLKRNKLLLVGGLGALTLLLLLLLLYRNSRQKTALAQKEALLQQEQIRFLERQQQVVSLQSMINGQETERTRIAKDLHDGLGGLFSTIKMHFSTLQHEIKALEEYPLFNKSYALVNTASEEVRRIAHNMMPEVLIKIGLEQAVQELCNSISAGKLLNVHLQSYGMQARLNPSTEIMLYRIVQELLNNIIKHAHATEAILQFNRENNQLSITVEDNGRGFDLHDTGKSTQVGLESVKSRVHYLNGTLSIDSQKEIGTTIMMVFLLNE